MTKVNPFIWIKDINLYIHKLKWKKFFRQTDRQRCQGFGISEEDLDPDGSLGGGR